MRNTLKTTVLLAGLGGLFVMLGSFFGTGGAVIGLVLALAMVGGSYWYSDRLAIRAAGAVEVSAGEQPWLHATVEELCARAGMPKPRVYISPEMQPNAFATGRNEHHAAVAVTQGLLQACTPEEVRGVLAHELGHVRNRDILIGSIAAAIATAISFVANLAMWAGAFTGGDDDHPNPVALFVVAMIAPLAAAVLQMSVSRSREYGADEFAARLIGTGQPLASALRRLEAYAQRIPADVAPSQASAYIVNPLAGRRVRFAQLFSTHPPVEDRIARLEALDARLVG